MHVLVYVRVSTDKQADKELSLPAQLHACRQYASSRGWHVLEEFIEPGASARTADRPELKRLLSRCRQEQSKVGAVIVHKLDRLARNLTDHVTIRGMLAKHEVKLVSASENLDDSTSGQLVEHIMASLAEFYSANLGEEVKKGMKQKVRQGGWPHKPPRGYVTQRDVFGRSRVEIDPVTGPVVRKAFEFTALGSEAPGTLRFTLARLGLTAKGGRLLHKSAVLQILRNPFYCGRVSWKGELFPGTHPALVTPEEFESVQRIIGSRRHERSNSSGFLTGIAQCHACGAKVSAETHGKHSYYRCRNNLKGRVRCRAPFCNMNTAHTSLQEIYQHLPASKLVKQALAERLSALSHAEVETHAQFQATVRSRITRLQTQTLRLARALADAIMEPDVYHLAALPLQQELKVLTRQLEKSAGRRRSSRRLPRALNVWQLHRNLPIPHQRELAQIIFEALSLDRAGVASHRLQSIVDSQAA